MEKMDEDSKDFSKILQNRQRAIKKKLDKVKQKEQKRRQGQELNEAEIQLIQSKGTLETQLDEAQKLGVTFDEFKKTEAKEEQAMEKRMAWLQEQNPVLEVQHCAQMVRLMRSLRPNEFTD